MEVPTPSKKRGMGGRENRKRGVKSLAGLKPTLLKENDCVQHHPSKVEGLSVQFLNPYPNQPWPFPNSVAVNSPDLLGVQ